jgi:hypothetical protein
MSILASGHISICLHFAKAPLEDSGGTFYFVAATRKPWLLAYKP